MKAYYCDECGGLLTKIDDTWICKECGAIHKEYECKVCGKMFLSSCEAKYCSRKCIKKLINNFHFKGDLK